MRLDIQITERKLARSRSVVNDLIKKGLVKVDGLIVTKPAKDFPKNAVIEITEQPKYVGRGGQKLERALTEFKIDPAGLTVLDVGSSTGGFTDCLLQRGAKKVYAVDVGTNQFDKNLKNDARVVLMEETDIRNIKALPEKPELAVVDVSFISLELVMDKTRDLLSPGSKIIALIKPQFETERREKNKSGVVKNDEIREKAAEKIKNYCAKIGLKVLHLIDSPILGGSGNKEYFILLQNKT
jgi:23S rRNA (cytidine1920-2'-O)/16S rRNA (cytidine1409-2'-O)-methyltransferase